MEISSSARAFLDGVKNPDVPRSPRLDWLADVMSLVPAAAYGVLLVMLLITRDPYYIVVAMGMATLGVAVEVVKQFTRPFLGRFPWLARPAEARGCGAFGGEAEGEDTDCSGAGKGAACPGMPSNHQATMAFFVFSMIFYHRTTILSGPLWLVLLGLNVAVGASRVYKRCHTTDQVVAGSVAGIVFATLFYHLVSPPERVTVV
jgi:membrane-associated phospholipid phosphatase